MARGIRQGQNGHFPEYHLGAAIMETRNCIKYRLSRFEEQMPGAINLRNIGEEREGRFGPLV